MIKPTRTLKVLQVSTASGSDPDVIDASHDVYGDWPDVLEPCDKSPTGQCEYTAANYFLLCIHCGKGDGV